MNKINPLLLIKQISVMFLQLIANENRNITSYIS